MMKAYIKVKTSDELPTEQTPVFIIQEGKLNHVAFLQNGKWWEAWEEYALPKPLYWLKEVTIPDEEEIKKLEDEYCKHIPDDQHRLWQRVGFKLGAQEILSKLK